MNLIAGIISKGLVLSTLILTATVAEARVFWNKVEATVSNDGVVTLTWNVTEYNNKHFHVQHSVDGTKWETLTVVESKNSHESMTDYTYSHKNRLQGKQYYRLKDTDIDISYTSFSPIKTLVLKTEKQGMSVWPNPATDRIVIENNDNSNIYTKATIFNLTGKVVLEVKLNDTISEIPVSGLSAGTYVVRIETIKGTSQSRKFVKQ
jgi:hypothetical protein